MTTEPDSTLIDTPSPELAATLAALGARGRARRRDPPRRPAGATPTRQEPDTAVAGGVEPTPTIAESGAVRRTGETTQLDLRIEAEFRAARRAAREERRRREGRGKS